MGTQVQTSSLIGALTRRPDVERVCVSLATFIPLVVLLAIGVALLAAAGVAFRRRDIG